MATYGNLNNITTVQVIVCFVITARLIVYLLSVKYRVTREVGKDFDLKFKPVINSNQQ